MNFWVDPGQVASYGSQVGRAAEHARAAKDYANKNCDLTGVTSWPAAFFQKALVGHNAILPRVRANLERGEQVLAAASSGLGAAAGLYRRLDRASAERLDATYPDASVLPRSKSGDPNAQGPIASCADREDPTRHLVPPAKPKEFTDPLKLYNDFTDLASPTVWMNKAIDLTIKVNPLDELTKLLVGDWEGYARCAGAWQALAKSSAATAGNLRWGLQSVDAKWDGKAAEAAFGYFDYTIRALESQAGELQKLHKEYLLVAETVWHFAKAAADILKGILDRLVVLGLTLMVAPFIASSGAGVFVSLGLGAFQCAKIISLWGEATQLMTKVQNVLHGSIGVMQGMVNDPAFTTMKMPAIDYRHPGA